MAVRRVEVTLWIDDPQWEALERDAVEMRQYLRSTGRPGEWETLQALEAHAMRALYALVHRQEQDAESRAAQARSVEQAEAAAVGDVTVYEPEEVPEWLIDVRERLALAKGA